MGGDCTAEGVFQSLQLLLKATLTDACPHAGCHAWAGRPSQTDGAAQHQGRCGAPAPASSSSPEGLQASQPADTSAWQHRISLGSTSSAMAPALSSHPVFCKHYELKTNAEQDMLVNIQMLPARNVADFMGILSLSRAQERTRPVTKQFQAAEIKQRA
eukprot:54306-Pelagomonas_calceolata.AAC.3